MQLVLSVVKELALGITSLQSQLRMKMIHGDGFTNMWESMVMSLQMEIVDTCLSLVFVITQEKHLVLI